MEELNPYTNFNLLGHEDAEKIFLNACLSNKMHHAWIISGPEGVGKATMAYRIARFLISGKLESSATGFFNEPIDTLKIEEDNTVCKLISAQSCPDLLVIEREFDEKSGKYKKEILVSEVRKVNEFLHKTSSNGNFRVVIVDSADKMNRNAQNAILKILEEPPYKTILILTATNVGAFLPTIKSRCRVLKLKSLSQEKVCDLLSLYCPDLVEEDKKKIAILSGGSIGQALKIYRIDGLRIYEEMLAMLSGNVNTKDLHNLCEKYGSSKNDAEYTILISMLNSFLNQKVLSFFKKNSMPIVIGIEDIILKEKNGEDLLKIKEEIMKFISDSEQSNLDRSKVLLYIFDALL